MSTARPNATPDVVIVGAGAGGASAAWALATQGVSVLVVEAGPVYDPAQDYALHRPDWALHDFPTGKARHRGQHSFAPLQALQPRWDDLRSWNKVVGRLNTGTHRRVHGYHHVRGVGGSTLHFTGEAHRLHPQALRMGTRFGVAADWPLNADELAPFYDRAEAVVGVAGPADGWPRGPRSPYPLPAHPTSHAGRQVLAAGARLGLRWEANALAVLSRPYDGRPACNYCNNCGRGCPRLDKGSADITFMRQALATGRCTLWADTPLVAIETGSDGRVSAVLVQREGQRQRVPTRVLVMACGAVETPRQLLLARGPRSPDGLANEQGQVGRHFMETLAWSSAGLHPQPLGSHRGLPSELVCWAFNAPDAVPGVPGGFRLSSRVGEAGFTSPASYAERALPGWGRSLKQRVRDSFGRMLAIGMIGESLPNPQSFVDLDPAQRDAFDQPIARIHAHQTETELQRLAHAAQHCRSMLAATGVTEVLEEYGSYDFFSATHVFGTCRMGRDPRHSVVDPHGRAHAWRNLYVADASVFPSTGGGESPSLTIYALALRTSARIRAEMVARAL